MLHLHRPKAFVKPFAFFATAMLLLMFSAQAQRSLYLENHDAKPYYFGITLSANTGRLNADLHEHFLAQDSVLTAEPLNSPGFALGLAATTNLTHRFQLRFNPQLMFTDRSIRYTLRYADHDLGTDVTQKVESVIMSLPLHLKFRSDRIGNFRVYMLGGGKLDYDLASNAQARKAEDLIKIQKIDYGVEGGFGFNFYFPSFILSPEIKISHGLNNIHARDANLKYSSVLDRINSRMLMFSIHIEG